ncbi:MAG TPA: rRNA maturation RNase YbeY [Candidatus Saccharimonadales bacterium]|nr:rRNA maturation RNase YbeY [Candidatus Saccharimonadales bacterium]
MTRSIYRPPWRIDVDLRPGIRMPASQAGLARVIAATLDAAGAPQPASIGLVLSDDEELARLDAEHMGVTGPTDVLSFPLLPPDAFPSHPGRPATKGGAGATGATPFALPPGSRPHLGDLVISVERAVEQASAGRGGQTGDLRWAAMDELRLLAIHGTLHICGWDHADPEEEAAMRALEQRLLA